MAVASTSMTTLRRDSRGGGLSSPVGCLPGLSSACLSFGIGLLRKALSERNADLTGQLGQTTMPGSRSLHCRLSCHLRCKSDGSGRRSSSASL
jgi:hypothetical protein